MGAVWQNGGCPGGHGCPGIFIKRRGLVIIPVYERGPDVPLATVLKIMLNISNKTVYDPEFIGADAYLVAGCHIVGHSVIYFKLGPLEAEKKLDIMLRLHTPPGYAPPGSP
jgi:hypothetical protein